VATTGPVVSEDDRFDVFISFAAADRHQAQFGRSVDVVAEIKRALERYRHPETARRLRPRLRLRLGLEEHDLVALVRRGLERNAINCTMFFRSRTVFRSSIERPMSAAMRFRGALRAGVEAADAQVAG
jgi:hypothetical protein